MKISSVIFFIILILSFIVSLFLSSCSSSHENNVKPDLMTETLINEVYPDNPFEVVKNFCENLVEPSVGKSNMHAAQKAAEFLSRESLYSLEPYSGALSDKLARYAGLNKLPDEGFHIMGIIDITDEYAWVETRLNYTSDHANRIATVRTFYLIKENNLWKIDKIM